MSFEQEKIDEQNKAKIQFLFTNIKEWKSSIEAWERILEKNEEKLIQLSQKTHQLNLQVQKTIPQSQGERQNDQVLNERQDQNQSIRRQTPQIDQNGVFKIKRIRKSYEYRHKIFKCKICPNRYVTGTSLKKHCSNDHSISCLKIKCKTVIKNGIKKGRSKFLFSQSQMEEMIRKDREKRERLGKRTFIREDDSSSDSSSFQQ